MTIPDISKSRRPKAIFFTQGFRPFFLAAALWAAIALALWIYLLNTGTSLPSRFDPLTWHIHEMLFGFVMAAVGGFLLTAIPNWTRRPPFSGVPLVILAALWLLGRLVCLFSNLMPAPLAVAADLIFPVVLVGVACREIIAGRNWRNLVMTIPVTVLGLANLLMHLEALGLAVPAGIGWRLGLAATLVLVSVISGRITPSFTRNWLVKQKATNLPAPHGKGGQAGTRLTSCQSARLGIHPGSETRRCGFVGCRRFKWLAIGTVAWPNDPSRTSVNDPAPRLSLAHHRRVTAGARHLAIAGAHLCSRSCAYSRCHRHHGPCCHDSSYPRAFLHELVAERPTVIIYAFVNIAAITRIAAALTIGSVSLLLTISAGFWILSFLLFCWRYGPMLLGAAPR